MKLDNKNYLIVAFIIGTKVRQYIVPHDNDHERDHVGRTLDSFDMVADVTRGTLSNPGTDMLCACSSGKLDFLQTLYHRYDNDRYRL